MAHICFGMQEEEALPSAQSMVEEYMRDMTAVDEDSLLAQVTCGETSSCGALLRAQIKTAAASGYLKSCSERKTEGSVSSSCSLETRRKTTSLQQLKSCAKITVA